MLNQRQFAKIYRISAWYDLILSWPYATAPTLLLFLSQINSVHGLLGYPPIPELSATGIMFGNFFGTVVVVWSIVRLRWNDVALARYDAVARWLFSAAMVIALSNGASPLLYAFLVIEVAFAVLQSLPVKRT